jgi:hypothetical protein
MPKKRESAKPVTADVRKRRRLHPFKTQEPVGAGPKKKRIYRRKPEEMRAVRYMTNILMDGISLEVLKVHALTRRVPQSTLVSDLINLWLMVATDYGSPLVREFLPERVRAADVPERWPGYIASLGYMPHKYETVVNQAPSITKDFVPKTAEPILVPPQTVDRTPPPAPSQDAAVMPVQDDATQPVHGWGNAAQMQSLGFEPDRDNAEAVVRKRV